MTHIPSPEQERALIAAAREVQQRAWAPYSRFRVGAAVLTTEGTMHLGCNVENATYGATTCAERNAVAAAVAHGARELIAVAVVTDADTPTMPCGICRQVLAEFADHLTVLSQDGTGTLERTTLDALLPRRFSRADFEE